MRGAPINTLNNNIHCINGYRRYTLYPRPEGRGFTVRWIRFEGTRTLREELTLFEGLRLNEGLDIGQITLKEFRTLVGRLEKPVLSNRAEESKKIKGPETAGDTKALFRDKRTSIKVPHTSEAARILGRGTKWCTASKDDKDIFNDYCEEGNLYVITNPII